MTPFITNRNGQRPARIPYLRTLIVLLLALASPCTCPTASAQTNAEQVLNIGRNVLSMDDYMLAIQYFNQAIKAKPYLAEPYFFRAIAKLSLEDYKGAETDCNMALERNKFLVEAYKVRGFARQYLGRDSLAVDDYNVGLDYNPTDKYFLYYKAIALTELERRDEAAATFGDLLRMHPAFEEGYTARARYHLAGTDTVAALADLDKAISLSQSLANPFLLRAEIEWGRREWEKAGDDIGQAIRLHPEVADLYVNRAFIRYNSDDFFGAMSDYNYALQLEPKNRAALFNRALLRYEVKDLQKAEEDLSSVLALEPGNFHALYNRGLVRLEQDKNKEALDDFTAIAKRYPKFYPVYYALAETHRNMGDMKTAMRMAYHGDDLVKKYVDNPEKNPLDRPAIAAAKSNDSRNTGGDDESEAEVMDRFNQLVTVSDAVETQMSYNERIKGRVQNRNVQVEPEPSYSMTFVPTPVSLKSVSNYFRELDDLNQGRYISRQIYLYPGTPRLSEQEESDRLFAYAAQLARQVSQEGARPVDLLALGIAEGTLKNYDEALANLDKVIAADPKFTVAYMARAGYRMAKIEADGRRRGAERTDGAQPAQTQLSTLTVRDVMADYDRALQLNPRLVYAWFNKGNVYYAGGDYTSAMQCYAEALRLDPEFGQAYFNRGLSYLQAGNKSQAFADLSRAGELGILPSYNILKRMK